MTNNDLQPAILFLEAQIEEAERKVNELLAALNVLRGAAGMPPRSPNGGGGGSKVPLEIRPDTFFGKRQQTAIREYLEMRRARGEGPAKPREIYDALLAGGYQYEAKEAETALVGLRALLRKRTNFFTKLPNGTYGLASWYEHTKKPRGGVVTPDLDDDDPPESKAASDDESDAA